MKTFIVIVMLVGIAACGYGAWTPVPPDFPSAHLVAWLGLAFNGLLGSLMLLIAIEADRTN
jgi:hypothetical protein